MDAGRGAVLSLLHRASWVAEKTFKARGPKPPFMWCTETQSGKRQVFSTSCTVERPDVSDSQALAALCEELAADFAADGVVRYAVAFPARATITLRESVMHRDGKRQTREVVALEACDATTRLRAHREIFFTAGVPRLAALGPVEEGAACFGLLLSHLDSESEAKQALLARA
jgi:hypothetical protein